MPESNNQNKNKGGEDIDKNYTVHAYAKIRKKNSALLHQIL